MHSHAEPRRHADGRTGHGAPQPSGRKLKPTIPHVVADSITATADEDEAELFLHTLKFALSQDYMPTAQHVQVLLYLVCYGPPPPHGSSHAYDKSSARPGGTGQGEEGGKASAGPRHIVQPAHSPEYIERISTLALDVLDNILTLHTARDVGRMVPHITHQTSDSAGPTTSSAAGGNRSSRLIRGGNRARDSSSLCASPEKEVYASELIGRDDTPSDYDDEDGDYTSRNSAGRSGIFGKAAKQGQAVHLGGGGAAPQPAEKKKRKRKTGILYAADFDLDPDDGWAGNGSGTSGRGSPAYGVGQGERGRFADQPSWLRWTSSGGSRLQRETYRAMRALVGTGQGGRGGTGVWPLLWAGASGSGQSVRKGKDETRRADRDGSESASEAEEEGEDGRSAERNDRALSAGGWKLLEWLVRLWEQDARETEDDDRLAGTIRTATDNAIYGRHSPLFLQQLPKYSTVQISDASNVERVIAAAFADSSRSTPQSRKSGRVCMPEVQARRKCAGRVLQLLAQSALRTPSSPPAFHPPSFTLEFLSLHRPLSSLSSTDLLNHIDGVPWSMRAHLLCIAIEDLARVRSARNSERASGKRDDFAPLLLLPDSERGEGKEVSGTGGRGSRVDVQFSPPRMRYLRDVLQLPIDQTGGENGKLGADASKDMSDKMANIKLALLSLLFANKSAYLDGYRHSTSTTVMPPETRSADGSEGLISTLDLDLGQTWADGVSLAFTETDGTVGKKAPLAGKAMAGVAVQLMRQLVRPTD